MTGRDILGGLKCIEQLVKLYFTSVNLRFVIQWYKNDGRTRLLCRGLFSINISGRTNGRALVKFSFL